MSEAEIRYINRPKPTKGPDVPYSNQQASNPVIRGSVLAPLTFLIKSSSWLQNVLWKLNKLDQLKNVPGLDAYGPRYDPTVIPISPATDEVLDVSALPRPERRKNESQYYTCRDYHELYKSGAITPLQVAEYLISIISRPGKDQAPDRYTVAYIDTKAELVLAAARASTERYKKGQSLGVLDGVPVAVKDELEVQGYRKMQGSPINFTGPYNETAWCARKWQEAGAVIIGKTNMYEIGMDTNGFNSYWGTPLNPHNEGYYCGGSSSGSACTTAQGICPIALGADGGGSIRIPSSLCGLYGLKPSHGRVSGRPTKEIAGSVGVFGPLASSLDDLAIAYRVMAQPDPGADLCAPFPDTMNKSSICTMSSNKVIGIDRAWIARSDPSVLEMFEQALTYYTKTSGYQVIDINIPYLPENQKAHALTIISEVRADLSPAQIDKLCYQNQIILTTLGGRASVLDFIAAQRLRNMMMQHLSWLWEQHPGMLILTPTTPFAGMKIGQPSDVAWRSNGANDSDMTLRSMEYVYLANWTGCPAITMPMGYSEDNVPVGLMAMGEWGSEEQLLSWAGEGDGLLGGHGIRRPRPEGSWVDVIERVQTS